MLDELVNTIKTLQTRIDKHRPDLSKNERHTRMALIDPLLLVLGWDPADPDLVAPEYNVSGRAADYALLRHGDKPAATIEAKKLGEPLEPHRMQMLNYSNAAGIQYAGLTDGDRWELYKVFDPAPLDDRRILDISVASDPVHLTALRLLRLWQLNLASREPADKDEPIFDVTTAPTLETTTPEPEATNRQPREITQPPSTTDRGWMPLAVFRPKSKDKFPSGMRFPDGKVSQIRYQRNLLIEVAEYLIRIDKLGLVNGTIESGPSRYLCNPTPRHKDGKDFRSSHRLSNGLFLETHAPAHQTVAYAKTMLTRCGQDPGQVYLNLDN